MANVAKMSERRPEKAPNLLAPWPQVDRYPTVIGPNLTVNYVSAAFRLCTSGYRQQYVDLLDEMMEKDPHAYSVVSKRVLTVGGGRVTVAEPDDLAGADLSAAKEAVEFVENELASIPAFTEALVLLAWATYYAVGAQEIVWGQGDDGRIHVRSLEFVHQRRLSYPDPWSWDCYIFDGGAMPMAPTALRGHYGLRIADYPGQFILHAPKVRGDYPTREGIGRQIAYWMTIKNVATRLAPQYLERYAIPWPDLEFNTKGTNLKAPLEPRAADDDDIDNAETAAKAMGVGGLSHYVHADAVKVNLKTPDGRPTLTFAQWIELCDAQMSKAALGATLTTEVGHTGGARAAASVQKQGEEKLYEFDATTLASTLKRDLVDWIVKLNFPALAPRLYPQVKIHVNQDPDPLDIIERATKAAAGGIPVDADAIAQQTDLPVIENKSGHPRRMFPLLGAKLSPPPEVIGLPPAPEESEDDGALQGAKNQPNGAKPNGAQPDDESDQEQDDARSDPDT